MPRFLLRPLSLLIVLLTVACDDLEEIDEDAVDDMLPLTDVEPTPDVDLDVVLTDRPRPTHDTGEDDCGVDDLSDDEAADDDPPDDDPPADSEPEEDAAGDDRGIDDLSDDDSPPTRRAETTYWRRSAAATNHRPAHGHRRLCARRGSPRAGHRDLPGPEAHQDTRARKRPLRSGRALNSKNV